MKTKPSGFTLIELMVAMAIVAILAAIGYPSYQEHIRTSRRADAQKVTLEAAQWTERFYTENLSYDPDNDGGGAIQAAFANSGYTESPRGGGTVQYNISLTNLAPTTFTLNAIPDSGSAQVHDKCGTLTLNELGVKGVTGGATATADECWK